MGCVSPRKYQKNIHQESENILQCFQATRINNCMKPRFNIYMTGIKNLQNIDQSSILKRRRKNNQNQPQQVVRSE